MTNDMVVNLDVLGKLLESKVDHKKDDSLVIMVHWHDIVHPKAKLSK